MVQFFDPTQEQEIKRRRRMAEALQKQGAPKQTEVIGGYAVPQSGLEQLARGLSGAVGSYQAATADTKERELAQNRQALMAKAIEQLGTNPKAAAGIMMQDPSMLASGLGLYGEAMKNDRAIIEANGPGKAPSGYKWNADNTALEAIPGGPGTVLPAEVAGRVGLAKDFLKEEPAITTKIKEGAATGLLDYAYGKMGYGDSGNVMREIEGGKEALIRQLTGAGQSESEAAKYADQYSPSFRDTPQTLQDKVDRLKRRLTAAGDEVLVGRGGGTIAPPAPTGGGLPVGSKEDGYTFLGGNPADPKSWRKD